MLQILQWIPGRVNTMDDVQRALDRLQGSLRNLTASRWTTVVKVADEARNTTTTLTSDSTLKVTLDAGKGYRVRIFVFLSTANGTMDYKYDLNYGGTLSTINVKRRHAPAGAVAGTDNESTVAQATILGSTSVVALTSGTAYVEIDALILTTTAGVFAFRWAQDTSDGGDLTVLAGSYLEWMRVAP